MLQLNMHGQCRFFHPFIQPFFAVWAANNNTVGAVTHSTVNRISRGKFSRGTSDLGSSIPCDFSGSREQRFSKVKQILLPLELFRFSWSLYAEIRILTSVASHYLLTFSEPKPEEPGFHCEKGFYRDKYIHLEGETADIADNQDGLLSRTVLVIIKCLTNCAL